MATYKLTPIQNLTGEYSNLLGRQIDNRIIPYFVVIALLGVALYSLPKTKSNVELINPKSSFELTDTKSKQQFIVNAFSMIEEQFEKNPDKPFRVISDMGVATILPPALANEVRNDPRLSFSKWTFRVK